MILRFGDSLVRCLNADARSRSRGRRDAGSCGISTERMTFQAMRSVSRGKRPSRFESCRDTRKWAAVVAQDGPAAKGDDRDGATAAVEGREIGLRGGEERVKLLDPPRPAMYSSGTISSFSLGGDTASRRSEHVAERRAPSALAGRRDRCSTWCAARSEPVARQPPSLIIRPKTNRDQVARVALVSAARSC